MALEDEGWQLFEGLDETNGFMIEQDMSGLNYFSPQRIILSSPSESLFPYASSSYSMGNSLEASQGAYEAEQGLLIVPESDCPFLLSYSQLVQTESIVYQTDELRGPGIRKKGILGGRETKKKRKRMGFEKVPYAFDHIATERRRREKLGQSFIELSIILPVLKKMDKASVLEHTIKHIKELEERVKLLEEKIAGRTVEVVNNKGRPENSNDCESPISFVENSRNTNNGSLLDQKQKPVEIEVKLFEKAVLVKVHCENHKGVLAKMVSVVEELQLKVEHFGAVPFVGFSFLDVILIAQVEEVCSIDVEEVARRLNKALRQCD